MIIIPVDMGDRIVFMEEEQYLRNKQYYDKVMKDGKQKD